MMRSAREKLTKDMRVRPQDPELNALAQEVENMRSLLTHKRKKRAADQGRKKEAK